MRLLQRFRLRTVGIVTALALVGGIGLPVAFGALDAQALTCSFGDNFYYFGSQETANYLSVDTNGLVDDDFQANLFCQYNSGWAPGYYEWVEKGTANCITYNSATSQLYMLNCTGKGSQNWALEDYSNGYAGQIENGYSDGYNYYLWDDGPPSGSPLGTILQGQCYVGGGGSGCGWQYSYRFAWNLYGPFR